MTCANAVAVVLLFSIKKVFWKFFENLQEYIHDGVVFWDPDRGMFLQIFASGQLLLIMIQNYQSKNLTNVFKYSFGFPF